MNALLVNDDGYKAAGIRALQAELSKYYEVLAVAPVDEQSWKGKSISGHHQPLTAKPVEYHEFKGFAANGTPADCTQLGLFAFSDTLPTFVVSGINNGANIGHAHIMSSGTIGAALEAAFQGVPAFASSMWGMKRSDTTVDFNGAEAVELFSVAATITAKIIERTMEAGFPKSARVIAINMPHDVSPDAPWFITKPHDVSYGRLFELKDGLYHNTGSSELKGDESKGTDLEVLARGGVSIVPINLQLTTSEGQQELSELLNVPIFPDN